VQATKKEIDEAKAADGTAADGTTVAGETGDELPRPFGSYTLLAPLGRGGMGEVFLAVREGFAGIGRRCVVKTLRPGFGDDQEYVARFLDEARVVVQLHHRNICPVFDVGKIGAQHYLAMEYIAGRDLRTVVKRAAEAGRPIDRGLALHLVGEILEALDYAHRSQDPQTGEPLQLVHRDVSPHNVMIGFEGDVRLIDFGLAASTLKLEHTAPNMVMGKVAYMAPEQVCAEVVDARTDQFAAAILAYELFTGERFYEDRPAREIFQLAAVGSHRPAAFASLPAELRAALDRALAADRHQRFPSCAELREALDGYRYQSGLRGDAPAMRAIMQQVFASDRSAERLLIAQALGQQSTSSRISPAPGSDAGEEILAPPAGAASTSDRASAPETGAAGGPRAELAADEVPASSREHPRVTPGASDATEATVSTPVASGPHQGVVHGPTARIARLPTEERADAAVAPGAGRRRVAPSFAALALGALVVVLVAVLVAVLALGRDRAAVTEGAPAPLARAPDDAPLAAPAAPKSPGEPGEPGEPGDAHLEGSPPIQQDERALEPAPSSASPPRRAQDEPGPRARGAQQRRAPAAPPTPAATQPEGASRAAEIARLIEAPTPAPALKYLAERCPSQPCAIPLLAERKSWATKAKLELEGFRADLRRCLAQCR
jgi:eukaryotic-like serine/threonine-protein kinase